MTADRITVGLTEALKAGVSDKVAPGMACAVGHGKSVWFADAGSHTYEKNSPPVTAHTIWDLASLTKIVATTNIAMSMVDSHELDLESHVQSVVGEFLGDGKEDVTVRNLLMHDSGLPAYGNYESQTNPQIVASKILGAKLRRKPGEACEYSCLGFITLMEVEKRLAGKSFPDLLKSKVCGPLGLTETSFEPTAALRPKCAPTEKYLPWRRKLEDMRGFKRVNEEFIQGSVHDPVAYLIGGVSGNAGLFSTSRDLAKVAKSWMLGDGPFSKGVISEFSKKSGKLSTYGLGFDTRSAEDSSAGTKFSMKTFGHTGYTGTTIWVDPVNQLFSVLLTNRINPTAANLKIKAFRPEFHDQVFDLIARA